MQLCCAEVNLPPSSKRQAASDVEEGLRRAPVDVLSASHSLP
jgi:hypothetical protein